MYKILVCGLTSNLGGIEKVVLNYYSSMDKEKFGLDFICLDNKKIGFYEKFEELTVRPINYYYLPKPGKNPLIFKKKLDLFFKEHAKNYDAVWVNLCQLANIEYLKKAKKYGIKKRIIHSHNGNDDSKGLKKILHHINKDRIDKFATDFWACSDEAEKWMFPDKIKSKVKIINNAINVKDFFFDLNKREYLRKELGISEKEIIIGNIGRISYQKNQKFILIVFKKLLEKGYNSRLILIGGGDDSELKQIVSDYKLEDNVMFLGLKDNVKDYYSVFDVFFFPSNYEGLPVTLLEAQANGIPILASSEISKQVLVNNNLEMKSLTLNIDSWVDKLEEIIETGLRLNRDVISANFIKKGFEISQEVEKIERYLTNQNQ